MHPKYSLITVTTVLFFGANLQAQVPVLPGEIATDQNIHSELLGVSEEIHGEAGTLSAVSSGWWQPIVRQSIRPDVTSIPLTLEQVLVRALMHSKQIQVFSDLPLIRETSIVEADAAFDWYAFLDSRWDDNSDPVGNSLTTGGTSSRFRDHRLSINGGLRKRTYTGGQFEISQEIGGQDNNSQFFVPSPQGTARFKLNYTQPLLRGRGEVYNQSLTCLATIDKNIAEDEFQRQLQGHLLEVTRAYWATYLERGVFYQKLNSYKRAKEIVSRLEKRQALDASASQVKSAQAALLERRSDLLRAEMAVKNAESRMRALVNDPGFLEFSTTELIPIDTPQVHMIPTDIHQSMAEAMQHRPEINQALKQIQSSGIRLNMSKHELMPVLNLITETYVAGLASDAQVGQAYGNQFDQGEPGYSIGLQFEVPLGNRAALARNQRRALELRQIQNQYGVTLETVGLEVKIAVREIETSQQELFTKEQALAAREDQLNYLTKRWERLPGEDLTASLMLENILNAQDRLVQAEYEYLQSQITYILSLTNLKRVTGTLLEHEMVIVGRTCMDGLPTQVLDKPEVTMDHFLENH